MKKLKDIAVVIRSKNAGPYELTLDVLLPDEATFEKLCASKIICPRPSPVFTTCRKATYFPSWNSPPPRPSRPPSFGRWPPAPWVSGMSTAPNSMYL